MQAIEIERQVTSSGEVVTEYKAGKKTIRLIGTFGERATLDDLLYAIASQRIAERFWEARQHCTN